MVQENTWAIFIFLKKGLYVLKRKRSALKNGLTINFYKEFQMNNVVVTERLLTAKNLGQMLSLSKRQIFRLNSCGKIPQAIKIGGSVRWSAQEISAWLAAGAPDRRTWEDLKSTRRD